MPVFDIACYVIAIFVARINLIVFFHAKEVLKYPHSVLEGYFMVFLV
jgi:hypothetical protein